MSKILTTDWQRVEPGQTTQIDLTDISRYLSARVRWRGVDNTYYEYSTLTNSGSSPSFPAPDIGQSYLYFVAAGTLTAQNYGNDTYTVRLTLYVGGSPVASELRSIGPSSTAAIGISSNQLYGAYVGSSVSLDVTAISGSGPLSTSNKNVTASTRQSLAVVQQTSYPSVQIDGQTTAYSGTLTNGQISAWQSLAGLIKGNNSIKHLMPENVRTDVQIEYTIEPYLPYTVQTLPQHGSGTTETSVDFVFTLTANAENSATKYHARIRLDNYSTMPASQIYESKTSQTGWSYWTGSAWAAFPAAGVNPGTQVKYTKTMPISTVYWDTASWDGYNYGRQGTASKVRIVISAEGKYALQINGVAYDALAIRVLEASNGEVGGVTVTLDNQGGAAISAIHFGDTLTMAINTAGGQEDYEAVVREMTPSGSTVDITAINDGILAERICKQDYPSQDIGLTVASIINTYCAPLTAANVDIATGFVAPVLANNKSPLAVLEELRKNYGFYYYVDKNWDMHLYKTTAVSADASIQIRLGE